MANKYKTLSVLYINDDKYHEGEKVLIVTLREDMKAGSKLYFRKNKYKKEDKHPDYVFSVPEIDPPTQVKETEDTWKKKDVDQDLPF